MSNVHINAARKCNRFKGNTGLLLWILADAASNGKSRKDGQPNLPFGWTNKGEKQLMKDMNIDRRRQTITDGIAELEEAGAIVRRTAVPQECYDLCGHRLAQGSCSAYRSHEKRGI